MTKIPKRISLTSEVVAILEEGISDGTWRDQFPNERVLCRQLRVSRPTLRLALRELQKKGLAQIRHGKSTLIQTSSRITRRTVKRSATVGLLINIPIARIPNMVLHALMKARDSLQQAGFPSEIYVPPLPDDYSQWSVLEHFLKERSIFCSVLVGSTEEQQRWFVKNPQYPAFVMGTCARDVRLPSLDIDYRSVCRHAAGMFLGRGHRRVVFIRPARKLLGYDACEAGFLQGFETVLHKDAKGYVIRYRENPSDLAYHLDTQFKSGNDRPTGLLIAMPSDIIVALLYLLKHGFRVPEDVSIVACNSDYNIDLIEPRITHYVYPEIKYSHRLSHYMLQLLHNGSIPAEHHLILSDFQEGDSLGYVQRSGDRSRAAP
jgi:LacI family transcriptional regulator